MCPFHRDVYAISTNSFTTRNSLQIPSTRGEAMFFPLDPRQSSPLQHPTPLSTTHSSLWNASFHIPSQECFLSSGGGIQGIHLAFVLCQPLGHHCDVSKHKTCCRFVSSRLFALSLQIDINIQGDFQGQYICEILEQNRRLTCVWGRRCLRLFGQGRHLGNGHWNDPREE